MNKRQLLTMLTNPDLWKKLSPEEIRLYLLLIIFAGKRGNRVELRWEELKEWLGENFDIEYLKKAVYSLESFHLVKINCSSKDSEIRFELLKR